MNPIRDCQLKSVNLFQDDTFFQKSPDLPVENVVTLIAAMGCLSHAVRGTVRDTGTDGVKKKVFRKTAGRGTCADVNLIGTTVTCPMRSVGQGGTRYTAEKFA